MNSLSELPHGKDGLAVQILDLLRKTPGLKASDLAKKLTVDRRDVNRILAYDLSERVVQDSSYRWRLRGKCTSVSADEPTDEPMSEVARLSRYYLECIGQDSDEGVSAFAYGPEGETEYAEVPAVPMVGADEDWWSTPGVMRVVNKVKADRGNLQAWFGYPVRLREHRTAKWRGFFVEPVFLWPIEIPENPRDPVRLLEDQPQPNFSVLRTMAMGDATALVEEAARLDEDLGLNNNIEDRPETDELIERLVNVRPEWDWQEAIDPYELNGDVSLAALNKSGIFNRAVVIPGKRSPYTQGLEVELKRLSEFDDASIAGTALGSFLSGTSMEVTASDTHPLIEVVPMNLEQRDAVHSALAAPLTIVTGPPGTGKSQVVTNLMVNAAWRGMKVLFASKNNKAVDVVEARINGLGNRPVLLRLGSKEYQAKLSTYLTAMLSGQVGDEDRLNFENGLMQHRQMIERLFKLESMQQKTLESRNRVDMLEASVDSHRTLLGAATFNAPDERLLAKATKGLNDLFTALDDLDPAKHGLMGKLGLILRRGTRLKSLPSMVEALAPLGTHLGAVLRSQPTGEHLHELSEWAADLRKRVAAAGEVLSYQWALNSLRSSPSFEQLALERMEAMNLVAENSTKLWRDWVQLAPTRLTPAQRRDMADYAALLQVITGPNGDTVNPSVRSRARALQSKVSASFSCWAVTSLSARGKVPFEPGHFDLVVIDEASQCDIASAIPLLYRAKRAVIIGDPMQLRHISGIGRNKDADLLHKHDLVDTRAGWMYSVNSLYDLSAGVAQANQIINLRDHHRSHGDIIDFSNQFFYNGRLRVATRYTALRKPSSQEPGVIWQDVKGRVLRPASGGAENVAEAQAVVDAIYDLLVKRAFQGSVGVVTPFRAQAQLIKMLVSKNAGLADSVIRCNLLVDTVHKFQGDERDVMFFSPVVSKGTPDGAISFLRNNGNLFNVAITRARSILHVVGDREAATECGVDYLEAFSAYVGRLRDRNDRYESEAKRESDIGAEYPAVANPERVSDWERFFYAALHQAGIRPLPQYRVEQYDLDFAVICGDKRLNIEVDGERYHRSWTGELCLRDQLRNQRLIELGWDVKRFWVYEIRDRLPECLAYVKKWVDDNKPACQQSKI